MLSRQQSDATLAAICSTDTVAVDRKISNLVKQLQRNGRQVVGVVQKPLSATSANGCNAQLFSISASKQYDISQQLGAGSSSCNLNTAALEQAAFDVCAGITANTHLVVVNRYGKREAQGGGFRSVFEHAMELGVPVLTVVQAQWKDSWLEYGEQIVAILDDNDSDLQEWVEHVLAQELSVSVG